MKNIFITILILISSIAFSQIDEFNKKQLEAEKNSTDLVYEANELASENDFVSAEMEYRKAISESSSVVAGSYNLGNAYYNNGDYEEALYRHQQAAKTSKNRLEKHKAFHNIGNILMQNKKCKEAVEAYKSALRNNPKDDESRYNLALAKECAKEQGDGDGEDENEDEDKKDQNKDQQDKEDKQDKDEQEEDEEGEEKDKQEDQGDQDKKEGDQEEDKDGKPQDEKKDQGEGENKDQQKDKPQPKPGQLSPQQIKNLLEAMSDQEQKVQEKINAKKQKGVKVKTDKDW